MQLFLGVVANRLVRIEEARLDVRPYVPEVVHGVAGDDDGTLGERLGVVEELGEVDVGHRAPAFAARGHAAGTGEGFPHRLACAALDGDRTACAHRGDVEGEGVGRADVRLPETAEEDAQHRVGVGGGADRRAGVGTHPLLVDDDRGRQPVEHVDLGPRQPRHEALHEGAVGLVDQALGLRGDRVEHQRALARAGNTGEHRQPPLRDLDADVLQVVLARTVHADHVVAIGNVVRRRSRVCPRGPAHRLSISRARSGWPRLLGLRRRRPRVSPSSNVVRDSHPAPGPASSTR